MNTGWEIGTNEQKQALLACVRNVALAALQQYDLEWTEIKFNKMSDTITYKITTENKDCFLLRIHNNSRKQAEIYGEIMFLEHLKNMKVIAPVAQETKSGEYVLNSKISDSEILHVTLMNWINGKLISTPTDIQIRNTGRLLAQIHNAGESFTPEETMSFPEWGVGSFRENMKKLSQYYSVFLSEKEWKVYQNAADKIISELDSINKFSQNYGIIHGDFHMENIIFSRNAAFPIDFGRCGYGYYLYDIASTILGLSWRSRKKYIEGYTSIRKLEADYEGLLEMMFIKVMIENYCHHCSDPRETEGLIAEQPYALAFMQAYLNGQSFLFQPLQITTE